MAAEKKEALEPLARPPAKPPIWNDPRYRAIFFQVLVLGGVILFGIFLVDNTLRNMAARGISSGFDFLGRTAGFSISMSLIEYAEENTYFRAFVVGLLNTLLVSAIGVVFTTILGFIIGIARLSRNWLIAKLAAVYIETLRNIPLLLQLFFWYFAVLRALPGPRQSTELGYPIFDPQVFAVVALAVIVSFYALRRWVRSGTGHFLTTIKVPAFDIPLSSVVVPLASFVVMPVAIVSIFQQMGFPLLKGWEALAFLNNRGLFSPKPIFEPGFMAIPIAFVVAVVAVVFLAHWARKRRDETGQQFHTIYVSLGILIGLPLLAAAATGFPLHWDHPVLKGFNFRGGMELIPELVALTLALSTYTATFIAEIVRAGILGVSHGQTEASYALGLRPGPTLRLVIIPQALRIIIPPLTSQYLNLTKNSSLAAAIAYPDLVLVFAGTVLMQTGQAVEIIGITMAVYLTLSLLISAFMNWYNKKMALVER